MLTLFKKAGPRRQAMKSGLLLDMQLPPFRQFNQIFQNDCQMVITKSAYQACVQLPGEARGRAEVPASYRWGILYLSFMEHFQDRADDQHEGSFDVSVMMPSGFQISKTLKVILDHDFDGKEAFVFMLPDELWPASIESRDRS
jgi:hypothetical protein